MVSYGNSSYAMSFLMISCLFMLIKNSTIFSVFMSNWNRTGDKSNVLVQQLMDMSNANPLRPILQGIYASHGEKYCSSVSQGVKHRDTKSCSLKNTIIKYSIRAPYQIKSLLGSSKDKFSLSRSQSWKWGSFLKVNPGKYIFKFIP